MFCSVRPHEFFHLFHQLSLILGKLHVNKIDNDDTANITQSQLAGNFFSRFKVCFQSILLLVIAYTFVATVYINYMQGLRVFNDQVSTTVKIYSLAKRSLDLFCNPKGIKNRSAILVKRNNLRFLGSYPLNVSLGIIKDIPVVNDNLVEVFIQQITKNACRLRLFT